MSGRREGQAVFFAVGQALELRHQIALVVFDFNGIRADFEVLRHFPGLGPERARLCGFHEGDARVQRHRHRSVRIARRRKRKVRQRENRAAMDRAQAVPMMRMQRHLRLGRAVSRLKQFNVVARGELVAFEKILNGFHDEFQPRMDTD